MLQVACDRNGDATGLVLLLRDLTEHRRAEDELRRSQTILEGILAIASDAVVCVNDRQRITFFNQGAERIFGYPEEVLGQPLETLIPHSARPGHARDGEAFGASRVAARTMGESPSRCRQCRPERRTIWSKGVCKEPC